MTFNLKEIQKAIEVAIKDGGPVDINITLDPMERLILSYTDSGADVVTITIFRAEVNKFPTITKTTRL